MNAAPELIFESLKTAADLNALKLAHGREDLHIEFKQKQDRRNGKLSDGDKSAFSKALSGFANADGGVLVFGIGTKKGPDKIDRAASLEPITGHMIMAATLRDSVFNSTHPIVNGVRVESIDVVGGNTAGYVKCLIPQSDNPPHRAMQAAREYWRRTDGAFQRMEHYELEDVFGRRLRPVLILSIELRPRPNDDLSEELRFYLSNEGRGVAKHSGFHCAIDGATIQQHYGSGMNNATALNGAPTVTFYDEQRVIHANGIGRYVGQATIQRVDKTVPLVIHATWYAENMQTRREDFQITPTPTAPSVSS
jgi:hypothetical protein